MHGNLSFTSYIPFGPYIGMVAFQVRVIVLYKI